MVDLADAVGPVNDDCQARLSNQQKRVEQLVADVDGILRDDSLHFGCARRLRGRLLFAKSVCYGSFGAAALRTLNDAISEASGAARDAPWTRDARGRETNVVKRMTTPDNVGHGVAGLAHMRLRPKA